MYLVCLPNKLGGVDIGFDTDPLHTISSEPVVEFDQLAKIFCWEEGKR